MNSALRVLVLGCALLLFVVVSVVNAQYSENTFRVRPKPATTLTFKPDSRFDLSRGGTVEFWVKHQGWASERTPFREDEYDSEKRLRSSTPLVPFSVLLAFGTNEKLGFAVTVSPGQTTIKDSTTPGSSSLLGITNSIEDLGNPALMIPLTETIEGTQVPLSFARSTYYHIVLVKKPKESFVTLYVDGLEKGVIQGDFGKTQELPLRIGWNLGAHTKEMDDDTIVQAWTYDGHIGGVRIWNHGLSAASIAALQEFGRSPNLDKLTLLKEYGDLIGYCDFTGARWDSEAKTWRDDGAPRVHFAVPLAGVWRSANATVREDPENGAITDFPVYTFVLTRYGGTANYVVYDYNVFEDDWYIGTLVHVIEGGKHRLGLRRAGMHQERTIALDMRRTREARATRSEWRIVSDSLPADMPWKLAGRGSGEPLTLVRATLNKIANENRGTAEARAAAEADDLTQVFLLGNNVRYRHVLYRGYNITKMNPYDLRTTGIRRDNESGYVLRPTQNQEDFTIDTNQQRIMPFDLAISNRNKSASGTVSLMLSNSAEYAQAFTTRIGAGVNLTLRGSFWGVGADSTFTLSGQYEDAVEQIANTTQDVHLVVTNSYVQHYALYHKKHLVRLNSVFQDEVRRLRQATAKMAPEQRNQRFMAFHRDWGTHFCFGATFGAMGWFENRIDKESTDITKISRQLGELGINEGKSGIEDKITERVGSALSAENTRKVIVGGINSPGAGDSLGPADEPSPIRMELRPIFTLLTPQHFPNEPDIYITLREQLRSGLSHYVKAEAVATLNKVRNAARSRLIAPKIEGRPEMPITVADVERYEREIEAYHGDTQRKRTLAIRMKGITYDEYQKDGRKISQDRAAGLAEAIKKLKEEDSENPAIEKLEQMQQQVGPSIRVYPQQGSPAEKQWQTASERMLKDLNKLGGGAVDRVEAIKDPHLLSVFDKFDVDGPDGKPDGQLSLQEIEDYLATLDHVYGPKLKFFGQIHLVPFAVQEMPIVNGSKNQTLQAEIRQFLQNSPPKQIWSVAPNDAFEVQSGNALPNPGGVNRGMIYSWEVPESGLLDFVGIQMAAAIRSHPVGRRNKQGVAVGNYYMRAFSGPDKFFAGATSDRTLDRIRPNRAMIWATESPFTYVIREGVNRTWKKSDAAVGSIFGERKTRRHDGSNILHHDVQLPIRSNPLRVFKKPVSGIEWEQGTLILADTFRGADHTSGDNDHVGVVTVHFEYSVLPNLQELLEKTRAAGSGDKRKWGDFNTEFVSSVKLEDLRSVSKYLPPQVEHDPLQNELDHTIPAGWDESRVPKSAVAYYAFSGDGTDAVGRAQPLQNANREPINAQRFQNRAYVRGTRALKKYGKTDDWYELAKDKFKLVDEVQLPQSEDYIEVPLSPDSSFSIHMDFTRGYQDNAESRLVTRWGDSGSILVCGDAELSIDLSDKLRLYSKVGRQRLPTIGPFPDLSTIHKSWQKLIVAIDMENRKVRLLINGKSHETDLPTAYKPPTSSQWKFGTCAGKVDELIFFDHALKWDEIHQLSTRPRVTEEEMLALPPR